MEYNNAEVLVTVQIGAKQALRGAYQAEPKVDSKTGKQIYSVEKNESTGQIERNPVYNLKTLRLPKDHVCFQRTILSNQFVQWAMSDDSRPKKVSAPWWRKLSNKNRIVFHVTKYVEDLYGEKTEFTYTILE